MSTREKDWALLFLLSVCVSMCWCVLKAAPLLCVSASPSFLRSTGAGSEMSPWGRPLQCPFPISVSSWCCCLHPQVSSWLSLQMAPSKAGSENSRVDFLTQEGGWVLPVMDFLGNRRAFRDRVQIVSQPRVSESHGLWSVPDSGRSGPASTSLMNTFSLLAHRRFSDWK